MIKYIIVLFLFANISFGHSVIKKLSPKINNSIAKEIYDSVNKCTIINNYIFLAIIFKESSFKLNPNHPNKNDVGLTAINMRWWKKKFNINISRLKRDPSYAINLSCKILKIKKKRFGKRFKNFWSFYHSGTLHLRKTYERDILRLVRLMHGY